MKKVEGIEGNGGRGIEGTDFWDKKTQIGILKPREKWPRGVVGAVAAREAVVVGSSGRHRRAPDRRGVAGDGRVVLLNPASSLTEGSRPQPNHAFGIVAL
jgi:hypothetical protein